MQSFPHFVERAVQKLMKQVQGVAALTAVAARALPRAYNLQAFCEHGTAVDWKIPVLAQLHL